MICTYFTAILLFAALLSFGGKYFPPTFFFLFLAAPSPIFLAGIAPVFDYGPNNRCAEPADILSLNTT